MSHFPNTMYVYVVDAHFIDKIEEKKSWTQVPVI